jgi:hypothetical protein
MSTETTADRLTKPGTPSVWARRGIGSIQLRQLQPEDLDTLYAEILVDGMLNGAGGGPAPKTERNIHGTRRGELLGLTRRNVELDEARLVVDQQLCCRWGCDAEIAAPKTSTSRRTIGLDPLTVALLRT